MNSDNVIPLDNRERAAHQAAARSRLAVAAEALWGTLGIPLAYVDVIEKPCPSCGAAALQGCWNPYADRVKKIPCALRGRANEETE